MLLHSINVNGLRNARKRQNVFNWLVKQKTDIALVQETHCESEEKAQEWIKEWKGNTFWSHGTHLSKGVAFLFNEHANFNILSTEIFEDGSMLSLKMAIDGLNLQIINIYAPNVPSERKNLLRK